MWFKKSEKNWGSRVSKQSFSYKVCKMSSLFKNEWSSKKGEGVVRFFRQFYGVLSLLRSSILSSRSGWSLTSNSTNNGQVTRIFLFERSRQSSSLLLSTLSLKVHKGRNYEEDSFPLPIHSLRKNMCHSCWKLPIEKTHLLRKKISFISTWRPAFNE